MEAITDSLLTGDAALRDRCLRTCSRQQGTLPCCPIGYAELPVVCWQGLIAANAEAVFTLAGRE